jgi:hypothetical protein
MNTQNSDKLYEIRIKEHLGKNSLFFPEDFSVEYEANGETILRGPIADQAALHGILTRICSLGLTLTFFRRLENEGTDQ